MSLNEHKPKEIYCVKKHLNFYFALITLMCLNSCRTLNGSYAPGLKCGYHVIKFISKNEFVQYSSEGYDYNSNWDYGKYKITKDGLLMKYQIIPQELKYESKNSAIVNQSETIEDTIEISILGFTYDSLQLDFFQVG